MMVDITMDYGNNLLFINQHNYNSAISEASAMMKQQWHINHHFSNIPFINFSIIMNALKFHVKLLKYHFTNMKLQGQSSLHLEDYEAPTEISNDLWLVDHLIDPVLTSSHLEVLRPWSFEGPDGGCAEEPFILRRLKSDPLIAADLPDKVEQTHECEMSTKQRTRWRLEGWLRLA